MLVALCVPCNGIRDISGPCLRNVLEMDKMLRMFVVYSLYTKIAKTRDDLSLKWNNVM